MEFNLLRTFVAVAKHGHLTRAAETIHLSQPAVSAQLKALEEEVGVTLFERSSSGMSLTPSGRQLLPHAEEVLHSVQSFTNAARAFRGQPTGRLALGTVLSPAILRVGELLARSMERFPQLELELHHVVSHEALARIRSGAFDASFYFGRRPEPDLHCVPLREIDYRVALPPAWASELKDSQWPSLAARPWILAPLNSSHRQVVLDFFGGPSKLPERIIEADNESVIANLVESGVGLSALPDEVADTAAKAGRIALWTGKTVTTSLWLVYSSERHGDPLLQSLVDVLQEVWTASPALQSKAA